MMPIVGMSDMQLSPRPRVSGSAARGRYCNAWANGRNDVYARGRVARKLRLRSATQVALQQRWARIACRPLVPLPAT
jgi:hypothetical protein